jgi:Family of unknown function (DUF5696)
MSMTRKALLFACLLVTIVFAGCSNSNSTEETDNSEQTEAEEAFSQGKALKASFMEEDVPGMKGVAENDHLQLFVDDQTGAIAVHNKLSGEIWHSNPPDRDTDSLATGVNKDLLSSQMQIDFYNNVGQINSVNTFADSIAHEQLHFEAIQNGVRVTYQFGKAEKTAADLPVMLSVTRYKELASKLDKSGQRALMIAYTENTEKSVYERNDGALNGLQLKRVLQAFEEAGYTEEDFRQDMAELNFEQEKPSPRIFKAAMEYTLDGDSLVVKVPVSSVEYPADYPINTISFLGLFGAGGVGEKGSLFVPDGSGALIHFNNGKAKYSAYQQSVYGPDLTMFVTEEAPMEQKVRLPVFGIIKENDALLGIIEEGASAATINADISGRLNSYNYVYPSFTFINKGQVTLQANSQERTLPKFQEAPVKTDFAVRYVFLSEKEASYNGMARYYQDYLVKNNGLPEQLVNSQKEDIPFYLQLVGSISKKKHFAGIPYQALEPLTTFDQAKTIINQMQDSEINNIKLKYSGWFNEGVNHRVPDKISVDKTIGGSKGLHKFLSFTEEHGISVFPDVALLTANSGLKFDEKDEASRTLRGFPAALYPMDPTLDRRDRSKSPAFIISPKLIEKYTDEMLKDFRNYKTGGISLRDLSDQLNSDYRKNEQIDRAESETFSLKALNQIHKEDLKIMADGGNAYSLPYLSDITDAPMSSSGFKIEDEIIPFYQMVVRGHIDYTGVPFNLSTYTDVREYVLKSLEYGSSVYFKWIHEPNYKVKDTEFDYLYAVNYEQWIAQATEVYHEVNEVLRKVQHEPILEHEKIGEGVYKTVYNNGTYIIVNYNDSQAVVEGKTVEARSFITGGEES